jgi:hypothetical protein
LAKSDEHDGPWLIDKLVPGIAAVVDDISSRAEHLLSRRYCQTFSVGFSSMALHLAEISQAVESPA